MEWLNINQLTKEMVTARLSEMDDPIDAAVEILEKTVAVALKDVTSMMPGHRQTVVAACQGTLTALLLKEHDLVLASVKIVHSMIRVANRIHQDPTALTTLSLHAIADMKRFLPQGKMESIRNSLDAEFMGVGNVLQEILDSARMAQADAPIP